MLIYRFKSWDWCWTWDCLDFWVDFLVCFWIAGEYSSSLEFKLLTRRLIAFLLVLAIGEVLKGGIWCRNHHIWHDFVISWERISDREIYNDNRLPNEPKLIENTWELMIDLMCVLYYTLKGLWYLDYWS